MKAKINGPGPETGVKLFVYWAAKLYQTTGYYSFFLQYRQEVLQIDLELMPKDGRDDDDESIYDYIYAVF